MRRDRQTDMMKLTVSFRNFVNMPKKYSGTSLKIQMCYVSLSDEVISQFIVYEFDVWQIVSFKKCIMWHLGILILYLITCCANTCKCCLFTDFFKVNNN